MTTTSDDVNQAERALFMQAPLRLVDSGYLKIQDKRGRIVTLTLNKGQRALRGTIELMQARGLPVRIYNPKARQFGGSTYAESVIYGDCSQRIGRNGYIIADDVSKGKNLYSMTRRFHRYLPEYLRYELEVSNSRELIFKDRESRIVVDSADKRDSAARSFTFQTVHVSEITRFPDPKGTLNSVLATVPDHEDTFVMVESTCKGVGDYFHQEVTRAVQGTTDWAVCFVPWWWVEEYTMRVYDRWTAPSDAREEWLLRAGCNPEQLQWRRWAIENKCAGDPRVFDEEYPDSLERAFLTSGNPVFHIEVLQKMFAEASTLGVGYHGKLVQKHKSVEVDLTARGPWQIWERPVSGHEYVIGADFSEGLGMDETFVRVFDRNARRFVAQMHTNKMDPELAGEEIVKAAYWYEQAFIVPEANAPGLAAIVKVRNDYPRRRIYRRATNLIQDKKGGKPRLMARTGEGELGWKTSSRTKKLLISGYMDAIRKRDFDEPSTSVIGQCMTYVDRGDGSLGAQQGCLDDGVIASALAILGDTVLPSPRPVRVMQDVFGSAEPFDPVHATLLDDDSW